MLLHEKITLLTCRFDSETMEADYQRHVAKDNLRNNVLVLAIGMLVFSLYAVLDYQVLQSPDRALAIRTSILLLSAFLLLGLRIPRIAEHQEFLVSVIAFLVGSIVNLIVWLEPSLEQEYYIGLVQATVFVSFLLRLGFLKSLVLMATTLACFVLATSNKPDVQEAALQIVVLTTMMTICLLGVYLLQRYRRVDFLKSKVIEEQNRKLSAMLDEARRDNERKLAALNTLMHFVRTPIHQIAGFTDLLINEVKSADGAPDRDSFLENAGIIKSASDDLASNVAKVLTYHRLDEFEHADEAQIVNLADMMSDFADSLSFEGEPIVDCEKVSFHTHIEPLKAALNEIRKNYAAHADEITNVEIRGGKKGDAILVEFIDNGPSLSHEDFEAAATPLARLNNFLQAHGAHLSMGLRIVARAAEICGGSVAHRVDDAGRNVLSLYLSDLTAVEGQEAA